MRILIKHFYTYLIFHFLIQSGYAQNLATNSGFELVSKCPESINTNKTSYELINGWTSASYGTPDIFNICNKLEVGQNNKCGFTSPFEGNGFSGIITWEKYGFREYLQNKLTKPLNEGYEYTISFRYKLSSFSMYSIDRIGISLQDSSYYTTSEKNIPIPASYTHIKQKPFDTLTGTWELFKTTYTAKGGETNLIIGNFDSNANTSAFNLYWTTPREPSLEHASYYYIDNLKIHLNEHIIDSTITPIYDPNFNINANEVILDSSYILQDVHFLHDQAELLLSSWKTLSALKEQLIKHAKWKVLIEGHTDDTGSKEYNQQLSEKRANSVKVFLISQGIAPDRITTYGLGQTKPISTSDKNINRRVEIKFYE